MTPIVPARRLRLVAGSPLSMSVMAAFSGHTPVTTLSPELLPHHLLTPAGGSFFYSCHHHVQHSRHCKQGEDSPEDMFHFLREMNSCFHQIFFFGPMKRD